MPVEAPPNVAPLSPEFGPRPPNPPPVPSRPLLLTLALALPTELYTPPAPPAINRGFAVNRDVVFIDDTVVTNVPPQPPGLPP